MKELRVLSLRDRLPSGIPVIDCTSRGLAPFNQLSPFFVGRGMRLYGDFTAQNVENAWQYCKVYPCHVGSDGMPTDAYFKWAGDGWTSTRAERYPMGKGAAPLYSYWNGEKLDYVEARKRIYIPLYAREVIKTTAYDIMARKYRAEEEFILRDFDAYDHLGRGYSAADIINDSARKMGHGFVLKFLLEGTVTVASDGSVTLPKDLASPSHLQAGEGIKEQLSMF